MLDKQDDRLNKNNVQSSLYHSRNLSWRWWWLAQEETTHLSSNIIIQVNYSSPIPIPELAWPSTNGLNLEMLQLVARFTALPFFFLSLSFNYLSLPPPPPKCLERAIDLSRSCNRAFTCNQISSSNLLQPESVQLGSAQWEPFVLNKSCNFGLSLAKQTN